MFQNEYLGVYIVDVSAKTKAEVSAGALLQSLETASTSEFGNVGKKQCENEQHKLINSE